MRHQQRIHDTAMVQGSLVMSKQWAARLHRCRFSYSSRPLCLASRGNAGDFTAHFVDLLKLGRQFLVGNEECRAAPTSSGIPR